MTTETKSLSAIVVGLVLLIVAFFWSGSSTPPSSWTEEDAKAYIEAGSKLHDMSFSVRKDNEKPRAGDGKVSREELLAQKAAYEKSRESLESSRSQRKMASWMAFGVGMLLTVGGLFVHKVTGGR